MPYIVVFIAVITLVAFLVVRRHNGKLPAAISSESNPTASQSNPTTTTGKELTAPPANAPLPENQKTTPAQPDARPTEPEVEPNAAEKQAEAAPERETPVAPDAKQQQPKTASAPERAEAAADASGAVVKKVLPNVSPGAAASMRIPVNVQLRVSVNKAGAVSDVAYVSPGAGNYFARLAQRTVRSWKFSPPTRNGVPEPSAWKILFHFSRNKTEASATRELE
jgi:TonB family protein